MSTITMAYDLEKYRDKREKVLGVKKKGISFGAWAATVSAIISTAVSLENGSGPG